MMQTLFVLLLPMFIVGGLLYLFVTLGDAIVTAATDWLSRHE